ncbi:MAG: class I SAM-dependent RNA methyltransferase [Nitrospinae bacterium]|nr:class I SAM-dependent RNA methyltransferase [Nitrospinota bacterium]
MTPNLIELTIDSLAFGGAGVGRRDGKAVFVHRAYPGDVTQVRVEKEKKRYAEAALVKIISPSPSRQPPPCPLAPDCGGCVWMGLEYQEQLKWKQTILKEQLRRIGGLDVAVGQTTPSPLQLGYRARIRLKTAVDGGHVAVGYQRHHSNDIVDVAGCPVANPLVNAILKQAAAFLKTSPDQAASVSGMDIETDSKGVRGRITLRMDKPPKSGFMESFLAACPSAAGLAAVHHGEISRLGETNLSMETAGGMELTSGPTVFSQVNPLQNVRIVEKVLELAAAGEGGNALDLYCGMGNISLPMAASGAAVTGVESSREAVICAASNAERLSIRTAGFVEGDSTPAANRMADEDLKFSVVVINPPRAGAREALGAVARLSRGRIVYVSCDPATLARDAAELSKAGFAMVSASPFDMFPHTSHLETVALFERS